jgi:hypothetical protein
MQANRQRTLADLAAQGPNVDYAQAGLKVMQFDPELGMSLVNLADTRAMRDYQRSTGERDFAFRQQEAKRAQGNVDRTFSAGQEKPRISFEDDGQGGKAPVRIYPDGRIERVKVEGAPAESGNPFSTGKMNEAQSKDGLYASRMMNAENVLNDPAVTAAAMDSGQRARAATAERIPFGVGNKLVSNEYQRFDQAQRDFINATLRRESGAVINKDEFTNAEKQYFPQPGDTPDKLEQKRLNRIEAIKGIAAGAGPGYKPDYKLDENKRLVPNKPAGAAPVKVKSIDEARKLPKGTRFVDPNGVERVVP